MGDYRAALKKRQFATADADPSMLTRSCQPVETADRIRS